MLVGPESRRLARFLMNGGIALSVNLVSRFLLSFFLPFQVAVILAYAIGMAVAFTLFRLFVFDAQAGSTKAQFARFAIVNLVAVIQVWIISVALAEHIFPALQMTWHPYDLAHFIGALVPVFSSYLGHKHFSFSQAR